MAAGSAARPVIAVGWGLTVVTLATVRPVIAVATLAVGLVVQAIESPIAGVAFAQVGVAACVPTVGLELLALEVGPAVLLVGHGVGQGWRPRLLVATVAAGGLLAGVAIAGLTRSVPVASLLVVATVAIASYVIHRYGLISLGIVSGDRE